jgi:hypothetical protein
MDVALGIEALIPAAQYYGSTTANTEKCFDELDWLDQRPKPTWAAVVEAYDNLPPEPPIPPLA